MSSTKRRVVRGAEVRGDPPMRALFALGLVPRTHARLETTGRRSGLPRRTPIGGRLDGDTLWIVPSTGARRARRRSRVRLDRMGRPVNGATVWVMGTDLLTIRVDLAPEAGGGRPARPDVHGRSARY